MIRNIMPLPGGGCYHYDGNEYWYLHDRLHREDGPAITIPDGFKAWYLNGERHREDGPAVIHANGVKGWWLNGKRHREDGPAIIYSDGHESWWLNGLELTENEHWAINFKKQIDEASSLEESK